MKKLHLHNNLSGNKELFTPISQDRVTMYVCGPTVYSHPHIGNARPAVMFDVLYRVLKAQFNNVIYARNITDIEDKIIHAALESNVPIKTITEKYANVYHEDLTALNVLAPVIEPFATDHIDEMISMIQSLIDKGHAYEADGHVLFDVSSYRQYGKLSKRSVEDMIAGARVEVATYKKNPGDFVLWKPSKPEQPGWQCDWVCKDKSNALADSKENKGRGRPGWHIECSAMIQKHLGETIDIHGGGHDLIFPHHENEIAQSQCAHDGKPLANYWVHNGFVNMGTDKMSKSLGNVKLVKDLLQNNKGETLRLALMSTHYRKPLIWTDETTEQANNKLDRLYRAIQPAQATENNTSKASDEMLNALNDDLNTPLAIDILLQQANQIQKCHDDSEKINKIHQLQVDAALLGLLQQKPSQWLGNESSDTNLIQWVQQKIEDRQLAKVNKDYVKADAIRDELKEKNIELEDTAQGVSWRIKS